MRNDDWFEVDNRENRFFSQLPSVLLAVVAIGMIVLVNAGAPHATPAAGALPGKADPGAPTIEAVQPAAKPAASRA